jgi:hypothetical protein
MVRNSSRPADERELIPTVYDERELIPTVYDERELIPTVYDERELIPTVTMREGIPTVYPR